MHNDHKITALHAAAIVDTEDHLASIVYRQTAKAIIGIVCVFQRPNNNILLVKTMKNNFIND